MGKSRFSMLLLEPGEIYFEDYCCSISKNKCINKNNFEEGRLKFCSKSLVFEPEKVSLPLIKLNYKDFLTCDVTEIDKLFNDSNTILIKINVSQYTEMLEDNVLVPFKHKYEEECFYLHFVFASSEGILRQIEQMQRACSLNSLEHNSMVSTILHSLYTRMVFDPVMMDDFTEDIIYEMQVEKITPLVRQQAKLAITSSTLYIQPFSNVDSSPVLKMKLDKINRMYKRRFLLRQVGIEIYFEKECSVPHTYLAFQCEDDRDLIYSCIEEKSNIGLRSMHPEEMTLRWQNGLVTNFDYLVYLNCLADRSVNDLTQYPVFPWIVADYTSPELDLHNPDTFRDLSKPMGALNPERLARLKERYNEMSDPKFLFGSHYSAPGLILFYLVRKYPKYMLCLQNGRFDHPDRMFNSVKDVYNNCLNNMSDFKELIPEFYDVNSKGDFLVNMYGVDFGERHDGTKVGDVELPPWARTPEDFITRLREALESEYVSRHLHLWIDLIFGYKQRGEEAIKANNVFHHVCYEGSVDLEIVYDMHERHALEVQIMEFGQIPKQLFKKPHVRKILNKPSKPIDTCTTVGLYKTKCVDTVRLHKDEVTCAVIAGTKVISVSKDGTLKVYDVTQRKQIRSVALSSTPLSCCTLVDDKTVAVGSWDNNIYFYDVEFGRITENFRAHDDSVSCLLWLEKERTLVSGGWDGVVRAWRRAGGGALHGLGAELDHDGRVTAIAHTYCRNTVEIVCGTSDGDVCIWDLWAKRLLHRLAAHGGAVCGVGATQRRLLTASRDGELRVTDLVAMHSVYNKHVSNALSSMYWDGSRVLWLGGDRGTLLQRDMVAITPFETSSAHADLITWIDFDENNKTLITASQDKTVKIWKLTVEI